VTDLRQYTRPLVITHVVATFFMVGMIWTVHHLHYPLFALVGDETYVAFQQEHVDRIGALLIVPWLAEGATLLGLIGVAFAGSRKDLRIPTAINSVAMAVVLIISGFWSAPAHGDLSDGFDAAVHDRLMNANLVRSIAWTVCGIAALWTLIRVWPSRSFHEQQDTVL
jgi:hypothetical protein